MDLVLLDKQFRNVLPLDDYKSLIWTDRYNQYGDFEIYLSSNKKNIENLQNEYYLWSSESEHLMILEDRKIESDVEMGKYLTITGRSLESILDRRIIWEQTILNGYLEGQIKKLLEKNIINPSDPNRKIPNFIFQESGDSYIQGLQIEGQYTGDSLYDAVKTICESANIGFKIILNESNQFVFSLYKGINRSYSQDSNPHVVFSPNFENIINSNYYESNKSLKNVTLVAGEGEGSARRTIIVGDQSSSGLSRRELYTDARDISSQVDGGTLTTDQYNNLLKQRGEEKLSENKVVKSFDGQVETTQLYKYGEDFYMGDIVVLENEYGSTSNVRVIEFINSDNESGFLSYPTFEVLEEV